MRRSRVDRSPTCSVRQLCHWFESKQPHPRSASAGPTPVSMDHDARVTPAEDVRAKFLQNLQMFEQHQLALTQSAGVMFRGSSPSLHQTAQSSLAYLPPSSSPQMTALPLDVSQQGHLCSETRGFEEAATSRQHSSEVHFVSSHHSRESSSTFSRSDGSRNMAWSHNSGTQPVTPDKLKDNTSSLSPSSSSSSLSSYHSRNRTHGVKHSHSHQPVIREKKDDVERVGRGRSSKKTPMFKLLSSQSGFNSWLQSANAKKSAQCAGPAAQTHSPVDGQEGVDVPHSCTQPGSSSSSRRRQSVADPQDVLRPQHSKRCHRLCDTAAEKSSPSRHSRMVSTASIQLRKHSLPVSRKRSTSEERRISVIQTAKRFPETLTKPCPMLDEWLSSLVRQARVVPAEDMDCEDDPLPARQQQQQPRPYGSPCSDLAWRYPSKCSGSSSYPQRRLSGNSAVLCASSEHSDASILSSEAGECSSGEACKYASHHGGAPGAVSREPLYRRRTSRDHAQPKRYERRSSEEKLSPQSSVTGASIPIHVTEEDEDSACVQSLSDSASVQLCVPLSEDTTTTTNTNTNTTTTTTTSPRQHLPLSPCSSLGSYHSAMSSNADSAVDMALPDDEILEMDASHLDSATRLKQSLLARSHSHSTSTSSTTSTSTTTCHTIMDSSSYSYSSSSSSSVQVFTSTTTTSSSHLSFPSLKLDLPSFLISDHSSNECSSEAQEADGAYTDLMEGSSGVLEPGYLPRSPSATSSSSEGSYCSTCWTDSSVSDAEMPARRPERKRKQSSWKKIRSIIRWSPFIQVFKKHRYPWIQLAGHQGNFQAGEAGSVLKKLDSREHQSFQRLMHDRLQPYVPEFRGVVEKSGERYVQLQDLLCEFTCPCVMDIKMGIRTYLEEELIKARKKPTLRKDMYQKMVDVDSNAPTSEEHNQRAVTKPRYMQWRDQMSSSVNLGFRIEGIKKSDGASSKDFKKIKTRDNVADILKAFIGDDEVIMAKYLQRLRDICATQESSEFFRCHEVVGSSLLFVHDSQGQVNVWMIDFGKTEPLPRGVTINHRATWLEGNHEDGYLFGLDNIISILEELQASSVA